MGVLTIGGALYAITSVSARSSTTTSTSIAVRRPGWIARRRARGGIAHGHGRLGIGYRAATSSVHLTERELAHHGAVFGGPGSGKTTFLQLLIEASSGRISVVVLDPK